VLTDMQTVQSLNLVVDEEDITSECFE